MRTHPDDLLKYIAPKRKPAVQNPTGMDAHIEGDTSFIVTTLEQSGMTQCALLEVVETNQMVDRSCDEVADEPIAKL